MKQEIQSWPEVPGFAHFCSLFKEPFDLLEFEIPDLEDALTVLGTPNDNLRLVPRLLSRLLAGCLPAYKNKIDESNYTRYLQQFFQTQVEEAEEDGVEEHIDNPFENEDDFDELSLRDKVRAMRQLSQFRLEAEDASDKLRDIAAESLRVEPLGEDHEGTSYWYFYGTRLYREVDVKKMEKARRKAKKKEEKENEKVENGEAKEVEEKMEENEDQFHFDGPTWSLICETEQDWIDPEKKYKKSKRKQDKELYETLSVNFVPEITKMFLTKQKEEQKRLLMLAPKRTSSRIQVKRVIEISEREREMEEMEREKEERERVKRLKKEEEERKDREWRIQQREERIREEEEARVREEEKRSGRTESG